MFEPAADNTLYETAADIEDTILERSNGSGEYLFVGRTGLDAGFKLRRTLILFDIASHIPPGATIVQAVMTLTLSKSAPGSPPVDMALHPVTAPWGEGASDAPPVEGQGTIPEPGDATWHQRFYAMDPPENWTAPGGDFVAAASASTSVGSILGEYYWGCTAALANDVQVWLDNPASNHGWILTGEAGAFSARRFNSRESNRVDANNELTRPLLTVAYFAPGELFATGYEASETPLCN